MDENGIVAIVGGGFAIAATLGCLRKAALSRSHRKAADLVGWTAAAVVLGLLAVSLIVAPGAWADAYVDLLGGGDSN